MMIKRLFRYVTSNLQIICSWSRFDGYLSAYNDMIYKVYHCSLQISHGWCQPLSLSQIQFITRALGPSN